MPTTYFSLVSAYMTSGIGPENKFMDMSRFLKEHSKGNTRSK